MLKKFLRRSRVIGGKYRRKKRHLLNQILRNSQEA